MHDSLNNKGNPIFVQKVKDLNKQTSITYAAEYFKLAYKNSKSIMHFKEKSLAKKLYFLLTNSIYENFILLISYIYLVISLLEPGNHAEETYEYGDSFFTAMITIETFIVVMFLIDVFIMTYIWWISFKQTGF